MARHRCASTLLALSLLPVGAACGTAARTAGPATPAQSAPTVAPTATGPLTVFAAASLTESFDDLGTALKATAPDLALTYSYASSGTLVSQIRQGARADVVATADTDTMKKLTDAGLVEPPVTFASNRLEIIVARGNPKGVRTLSDLARSDLKVVLGDDSVPVGRYAAQVLRSAGVTVRPVSEEVDVKSAVARVTGGEADASVVYLTDVEAAGAKGEGVPIPDAQNVVAEYPIAILTATRNRAGAVAFVDSVVRGAGAGALRRRGFLPPAGS